MSQAMRKAEAARFEVRPLTPTIGAEIHGIDLRRPLDGAALARILGRDR